MDNLDVALVGILIFFVLGIAGTGFTPFQI